MSLFSLWLINWRSRLIFNLIVCSCILYILYKSYYMVVVMVDGLVLYPLLNPERWLCLTTTILYILYNQELFIWKHSDSHTAFLSNAYLKENSIFLRHTLLESVLLITLEVNVSVGIGSYCDLDRLHTNLHYLCIFSVFCRMADWTYFTVSVIFIMQWCIMAIYFLIMAISYYFFHKFRTSFTFSMFFILYIIVCLFFLLLFLS